MLDCTENITVRVFPVKIRDLRTNKVMDDEIIVTKAALQAAQVLGMHTQGIIRRDYARAGFYVDMIGKPRKVTLTFDLVEAVAMQEGKT
jgi:hypothetical protein